MTKLITILIAAWTLTITERTVTEEQMYTLGTYMQVGMCASHVFDNSVMTICRHARRVSYNLKFREWFE